MQWGSSDVKCKVGCLSVANLCFDFNREVESDKNVYNGIKLSFDCFLLTFCNH